MTAAPSLTRLRALSLLRIGIKPERPPKVGSFSSGQRRFLDFHRENVLLRSSFLEHL